MELKSRWIVHVAVSNSPTDEWTAQQLREAKPSGKGPKYLLHDRDSKYGSHFSCVDTKGLMFYEIHIINPKIAGG